LAVEYRNAKTSDTEGIKEFLNSNNLPSHDIDEHIQNFIVVVSENKQIVGVGGFESIGGIGMVRSIAVAPEARRKGIAKKVYMQLESMAYESGVKAFYLITESAVSYFTRLGFVPLSRQNVPKEIKSTKQFREICPTSATVMYRDISRKNG